MNIFNHKKGFTLVEVLIATTIMVTVLGALVYSLSQSLNLTETARNQDIALNAAQDSFERIRNLEDVGSCQNPSAISDYHGCAFAVAGLTAPQSQSDPGQIQVTTIQANQLYDVTITVGWQQKSGREFSRTLSSTLLQ